MIIMTTTKQIWRWRWSLLERWRLFLLALILVGGRGGGGNGRVLAVAKGETAPTRPIGYIRAHYYSTH